MLCHKSMQDIASNGSNGKNIPGISGIMQWRMIAGG